MENPKPARSRTVPPRRRGGLHVIDATGYSIAGLRRLWLEAAVRLELAAACIVMIAFFLRGVDAWHWFVAGALLAVLLAIEALNTAIEVLTDHLSPEWSQMAKDAKDLGSLAVGLIIVLVCIFVGLVMTRVI